jgi:hypothetical protein
MTSERSRQIGELFEVAFRIDPIRREAWLRATFGGGDVVGAEIGRLLAQDERTDRVRFLSPVEPTGAPPDRTANWPPRVGVPLPSSGPAGRSGDAPAETASL